MRSWRKLFVFSSVYLTGNGSPRNYGGLFGGDVGIRTPARAEPAYRISNPDPSTAWVHLHGFLIPGHYISGCGKNQDFSAFLFLSAGNHCPRAVYISRVDFFPNL